MKALGYVPLVSMAGLLVVGHCISSLVRDPISPEWLILAALTLLTGSFTVKVPSLPARLSVSDTFVFASVILFGTCAGTVTVAIDILVVIMSGTGGKVRDPLRVLFNLSSAALSVWGAGQAFYGLAGLAPLSGQNITLQRLLVPVFAMAVTYFLLNTGMIAIALGLQRRESALVIWKTNFLGLLINYIAGASLAALLVSYTRTIDFVALGIIVPLLVISYLTFKKSFGRVEDATKHVEEVSRLYLSTIEALATAIDAKDQVTAGHIRRVQRLALGLAREHGVKDERQLKALEAAALLHDTGKLVVPEYILNKPGKLSPAEFEKMKLHASVGAEILSSIGFPYPVVPIVRHHHENWDGTGYPDGLKGIEIPIGARILSVVDCFDALTSDRPYRARLSNAQALAIVMQRRGSMYDPLIVDTFARVRDTLLAEIPVEVGSVLQVALDERLSGRLEPIDSGEPSLAAQGDRPSDLTQALDTIRLATDCMMVILFLKDTGLDELVSVAAATAGGNQVPTYRIGLGTRISGWVAVNGRAISNADAPLDGITIGQLPLAKCSSVPVVYDGEFIGAITAYSADHRGFSETDLKFMESVAATLSKELLTRLVANVANGPHANDYQRRVH